MTNGASNPVTYLLKQIDRYEMLQKKPSHPRSRQKLAVSKNMEDQQQAEVKRQVAKAACLEVLEDDALPWNQLTKLRAVVRLLEFGFRDEAEKFRPKLSRMEDYLRRSGARQTTRRFAEAPTRSLAKKAFRDLCFEECRDMCVRILEAKTQNTIDQDMKTVFQLMAQIDEYQGIVDDFALRLLEVCLTHLSKSDEALKNTCSFLNAFHQHMVQAFWKARPGRVFPSTIQISIEAPREIKRKRTDDDNGTCNRDTHV